MAIITRLLEDLERILDNNVVLENETNDLQDNKVDLAKLWDDELCMRYS